MKESTVPPATDYLEGTMRYPVDTPELSERNPPTNLQIDRCR